MSCLKLNSTNFVGLKALTHKVDQAKRIALAVVVADVVTCQPPGFGGVGAARKCFTHQQWREKTNKRLQFITGTRDGTMPTNAIKVEQKTKEIIKIPL